MCAFFIYIFLNIYIIKILWIELYVYSPAQHGTDATIFYASAAVLDDANNKEQIE